ncbi:MAG: hypothetical protein NVSMB38_40220 [Ktedonobacteraceae bacterium]
MREGLYVLLVNMVASELGYKMHWTRLANGVVGETFSLANEHGDYRSFTGKDKFERALEWLRKKA